MKKVFIFLLAAIFLFGTVSCTSLGKGEERESTEVPKRELSDDEVLAIMAAQGYDIYAPRFRVAYNDRIIYGPGFVFSEKELEVMRSLEEQAEVVPVGETEDIPVSEEDGDITLPDSADDPAQPYAEEIPAAEDESADDSGHLYAEESPAAENESSDAVPISETDPETASEDETGPLPENEAGETIGIPESVIRDWVYVEEEEPPTIWTAVLEPEISAQPEMTEPDFLLPQEDIQVSFVPPAAEPAEIRTETVSTSVILFGETSAEETGEKEIPPETPSEIPSETLSEIRGTADTDNDRQDVVAAVAEEEDAEVGIYERIAGLFSWRSAAALCAIILLLILLPVRKRKDRKTDDVRR